MDCPQRLENPSLNSKSNCGSSLALGLPKAPSELNSLRPVPLPCHYLVNYLKVDSDSKQWIPNTVKRQVLHIQ